jgi:hypothetical protein
MPFYAVKFMTLKLSKHVFIHMKDGENRTTGNGGSELLWNIGQIVWNYT